MIGEQKTKYMKTLAQLESLLQARKLDGTLTRSHALPAERLAETGVDDLDRQLGGGLSRGHLSEIVGTRSSGRTSVLYALLAAATRRGEIVALVDTFDRFDPCSAETAGIDLTRLLWVRGQQVGPRELHEVMNRAVKAAGLVFQAGGFGIVVIDVADAPLAAVERLPFTTWLRLARALESSETVGVVVTPRPVARSASGRSIVLSSSHPQGRWAGDARPGMVFRGLGVEAEVRSARQVPTTLRLEPSTQHAARST